MSYQVAGKRYYPMRKVAEFSQTGKASMVWQQIPRPQNLQRRALRHEYDDQPPTNPAHSQLCQKVTNLANGKSVVVRINDRGPFHSSRVMDLSRKPSGKLGLYLIKAPPCAR